MNDRLTPVLPLELKRANTDAMGHFTAYASTWGGPPDSYGDIIAKGAFEPALNQHKKDRTVPALLWSHDASSPIGKVLSLKEDNHGLLVAGKLTLGTRRGKEAHALLKDDALAMSIGFAIAEGGSTTTRGVRTIKAIRKLAELSMVALPANVRAKVLSTKSRPETRREYELLLRSAAGLSCREAARAAAGGWGALVRQEQDTDLDHVLEEIREIREILRTR